MRAWEFRFAGKVGQKTPLNSSLHGRRADRLDPHWPRTVDGCARTFPFWQEQVRTLRELITDVPPRTAAFSPLVASRRVQPAIKASELFQFEQLEDAVRYIAVKNGGVFKPMSDKLPLIEAGFIEDTKY